MFYNTRETSEICVSSKIDRTALTETLLRELEKSCDSGDLKEEMIRDQIVNKCSSHNLTQMLLQQEDLDLAEKVKIAGKDPNGIQSPLITCVPLVDPKASTIADVVARMATA